jgi:hypothetical protein
MKTRIVMAVIFLFFLAVSSVTWADDAPVPETPTSTPTDDPVVIPTDFPVSTPTDIPADIPTLIPTDVPPSTPTDVPAGEPTDSPTDEPTIVLSPTPTQSVSTPPIVDLSGGATFYVLAGSTGTISLSASDELGVLRIVQDAPLQGSVEILTTDPVETAPPYVTGITIHYTAPGNFAGVDTLTLKAVNAAGLTTSALITINVSLPQVPTSPTPLPTSSPSNELLITDQTITI